jgi:hypothetical protein
MKIKTIVCLLLTIACLFQSCKKEKEVVPVSAYTESYKLYSNNQMMKTLKQRVLVDNDTSAYNTLERIYLESGHKEELLYYALHMAEGEHSGRACFTTYFLLRSDNNNEAINELAVYYLIKAYELNDKSAIPEITDYFDADKIPSSTLYLRDIR